MKRYCSIFAALSLALCLLFAACGGGEGDPTTTAAPDTSYTPATTGPGNEAGPAPFSRAEIAAVTGDLRTVQDYVDLVPVEAFFVSSREEEDTIAIEFSSSDVPVAGGGEDILMLLVRDHASWEFFNKSEMMDIFAPADFPAELLPLDAELVSLCFSEAPIIAAPRGLGIGSRGEDVLAAYPETERHIDDYPVFGGDIIPGWQRVLYGTPAASVGSEDGDYIYYIFNAEGLVADIFFNTYRGAEPSLQHGAAID